MVVAVFMGFVVFVAAVAVFVAAVFVPWEGLSAVSFGILLHLFSASIFSQKVFRGSKLTRVFLQPFCNRAAGNPTGAWQAGRH